MERWTGYIQSSILSSHASQFRADRSREWSCQRGGRGPSGGCLGGRRNSSKALIGQIEKALQGLGGLG